MPHGLFNDPHIQTHAARINYHRRGIQNAFPDQGALTSHLMAVEVVEAEDAEDETRSSSPPPSPRPRLLRWLLG